LPITFGAGGIRESVDSSSTWCIRPEINVLDADVISVHIVFHEFLFQVRSHLNFRDSPIASWPRLFPSAPVLRAHNDARNVWFTGAGQLPLPRFPIWFSTQLENYFRRTDAVMIGYGVDTTRFRANSSARAAFLNSRAVPNIIGRFRPSSYRKRLEEKRGSLHCSMRWRRAASYLSYSLLWVPTTKMPYEALIRTSGISDRVHFLNPSSDVLQFYAAADAYVGPSLEDAYALPILEAMACGLPVVASSRAGVSEIITHRKKRSDFV